MNPGFHEKPKWFKESFLDIREDVEEAKEEGKRVMLYFYQDGCPYCGKLLGENLTDQRIVTRMRKGIDVIAINMWGDKEVTGLKGEPTTEKQFAASLRVQFTPTILFLNESGQVILRINGYFPPDKFLAVIDYINGRHDKKMRFPAYFAANAPKAASGKLHQLKQVLPKPLKLADQRKTSSRPLLVIFEQRTCQPCDELHGDTLKRPLVAYALTNVDVAQVDVWSQEPVQTPGGKEMPARKWANKLGVQYTPSLVFFDADGKEVFRTEAYLRSFHVHGAIDYVATGAYKTQPNFQRFLQTRTDALHARGFKVDLMD